MKKRTVSLLLTLLPTVASAADPKQVYVSGTNVVDGGYWKVDDGTGELTAGSSSDYNVAYDASNQTLTLNNATITKPSWSQYGLNTGVTKYNGLYAGVHTDGSINIKLIGDNTISVYSATTMFDTNCAGIAAANENESIKFTGSGNLIVEGGRTSKNSFGAIAGGSVVMSGTGSVEIYGSVSGDDKISAGIYLLASKEDVASSVVPESGSLKVGTSHGGAASYGVYGKTELSYFNSRATSGKFVAYCNILADTAVALSMPPMYPPLGNTALVARTGRAESGELVAYRAEDNGLYSYVELLHDLDPGADVQGLTEKSHTAWSITMNPATIKGTNPGGQVVEYAVGKENNADLPTAGWQTSPVFDGLAPNVRYWVWARTAATTTRAAGAAIHTGTICTTPDGNAGLYVNGIAIDKTQDSSTIEFENGKVTYEKATRTLTFSGDVEITHGYTTAKYGQMAGIFSNAELHIVLASGANLRINLKNYERDMALSMSLETSYPISGQCFGILNEGDLTIEAEENCEETPTLEINVLGAGQAIGIRAKEFKDASSAVVERGDLTIGAVDTSITVRGMSSPALLSQRVVSQRQDGYPGVTPISCGTNLTFDGTTGADKDSSTQYRVQTVGGYGGNLFTSGTAGNGIVQMNGGYVYAEDNGRNGDYRISYFGVKWALGYVCTNAVGERVDMDEAMWIKGSATFNPNGEMVLKGTLRITGKLEKGYKLTATVENGNLSSSDKPVYQWYRYRYGTETAIKEANNANYTLTSSDIDCQIYCVLTCDSFAGSLVSDKTDKVSAGPDIPAIYIAGVQLDKFNADDVLKDSEISYEGKISYDIATNVLTLDNVKLTYTGDKNAIIYSNVYGDGFTINLVGENTLSTTDTGKMAISCNVLAFVGEGSLYAHADYPSKATINVPWQMDVGENCSITTTCKEHQTLEYDSYSSSLSGALFAGDLNVTDNAYLYAYINDAEGDESNAKCCAAQVEYIATIKDNARMRVEGSRHEGLIVGYLHVEGGNLEVSNIGNLYVHRGRQINKQYAALKISDKNAAAHAITNAGGKLVLSGGKVDIYSQLGFGIRQLETGVHPEMVEGKIEEVHTVLVDNLEIYNSTLIVRMGAEAKATAPVTIEDTEEGTIIADNCTVYAGTDETCANATLSTKDAFLTKGNRYIRLHEGTAVDVSAESVQAGTIRASIAVGPQAETEASVMIARYNAYGRLMELKYETLNLSGELQTVSASFANAAADDTYKIYVLDGTRYVPLNSAISVS